MLEWLILTISMIDDLNNVGTIIQEHPWPNLTAAQISEKLRITHQYLTAANNRTQELRNPSIRDVNDVSSNNKRNSISNTPERNNQNKQYS